MLKSILSLFLLGALPSALAQNNEQTLGVYIFHRHGDRTAKSTPPVNLTTLGYDQVFSSGRYYRDRYITSGAEFAIQGISNDLAVPSQIFVSAPQDVVLQNSATGFMQGLYPPVGDSLATSSLRNGTNVKAPLNGYQLVPVSPVDGGTSSEDNGWLQSASGCSQATTSSNLFFSSAEYNDLSQNTQDFYKDIYPSVNNTFNQSQVNFKNAYTVYDLINVAEIHNASFDTAGRITSDVFFQLQTLADAHEWGLAYNESETVSDNVRGISAMVLAGEILGFLNGTLNSGGKQKVAVQFGAYATFFSFFGFANLPEVDSSFRGIATYASSMVFELFTNASTTANAPNTIPSDDVYVRFLFSNGTASSDAPPTAFPLFGSEQDSLRWTDFANSMNKFAVRTTERWCDVCGNSDGVCVAYKTSSSSNSTTPASSTHDSDKQRVGLSPAVNGVIGAMVALAVVLGLELLILSVGGFRIISKRRAQASKAAEASAGVSD